MTAFWKSFVQVTYKTLSCIGFVQLLELHLSRSHVTLVGQRGRGHVTPEECHVTCVVWMWRQCLVATCVG